MRRAAVCCGIGELIGLIWILIRIECNPFDDLETRKLQRFQVIHRFDLYVRIVRAVFLIDQQAQRQLKVSNLA